MGRADGQQPSEGASLVRRLHLRLGSRGSDCELGTIRLAGGSCTGPVRHGAGLHGPCFKPPTPSGVPCFKHQASNGFFRSMAGDGRHLLVRPWTGEDDTRLAEMVAQKRQRTAIALALRRSKRAVSTRLTKLRGQVRKDIQA